MSENNKPEAVVLSGGSARFYFELGALDVLIREAQIDPFAFLGVSAGALISSVMAQAERAKGHDELVSYLDRLEQIAFAVRSGKDVYKRRFPPFDLPGQLDELLALAFKPSMFRLGPLSEKIDEAVSLEKLKNSGRSVRVGAVCLESGEYVAKGPDEPDFKKYVRASSSIPLIFDPVEIGGQTYVDGGLINVTPLSDLFKMCEAHQHTSVLIHVILSTRRGSEPVDKPRWGSVDILQRTMDIMVDEIFKNDIEVAKMRNSETGKVEAEILIYEPDVEGPGIEPLQFEPAAMRRAFERGQQVTRDVLKKRASETVPT